MSTPCPVFTQNTSVKVSSEEHVALASLADEKLKVLIDTHGLLKPGANSTPLIDVYEKTPFDLRGYLVSAARCNASNAIEINTQLDKIDRIRQAGAGFEAAIGNDKTKSNLEIQKLVPGSSIDQALYNAFWADSVLQKLNIDYKPLTEFRKTPSSLTAQFPGLPEDKAKRIAADAEETTAGASMFGNRADEQRKLQEKKAKNEGELVQFSYQSRAIRFSAVSKVIKAQEYLILGEEINNKIPLPKPLDVARIYLKDSKAEDSGIVKKWESSLNAVGVNRPWDRGANILSQKDTERDFYGATAIGIPTALTGIAYFSRSYWAPILSGSLSNLTLANSAAAFTPVGIIAGAIGTGGYQYAGKVHTTQQENINAALGPKLTATTASAVPEAKRIGDIDGQITSVTKAAYLNAGEIKKAGKLLGAQLGAQQTVLSGYIFQASELNVAVRAQARAVTQLINEQNTKK